MWSLVVYSSSPVPAVSVCGREIMSLLSSWTQGLPAPRVQEVLSEPSFSSAPTDSTKDAVGDADVKRQLK